MRQAIHILRKDVRCLWPSLLIALALQALFTFFEMHPPRQHVIVSGVFNAEALVDVLLPVAWWYLITSLVHQEPLPGDRQFWVTRPYSWKSLLAAKLLFIFLFVNLAVAAADCFILTAHGFSAAAHWKSLLWRQIPFTVAVLIPPLALGALTCNLGQVMIAILLVILRIVVNSIPFEAAIPGGSTAVAWTDATVSTIVFLIVLSAIILIQYRRRLTGLARTLAVAFVVFPGFSIPVRWQLDWQARVKPPSLDGSKIKIAFDPGRAPRSPRSSVPKLKFVNVALPVSVNGAPDGVEIMSRLATLAIQDNGRTAWSTDAEDATLERDKTGYWETIVIPAAAFASTRSKPVTVRLTAVVSAVRKTEFRTPIETGPVPVPDVGFCESMRPMLQFLTVTCRSAFRSPPRTRIHADYPGWDARDPGGRPREQVTGDLSDSPFPAELGLSPVRKSEVFSLAENDLAAAAKHPGTQLVFEIEHPIAHFQTQFELQSVNLEQYALTVPEN